MRWKGLFVTALAAVVAVGFWSAPASANLDNDEVGAALAMPFLSDSSTVTYMTVTNGTNAPQTLEIRLIDGDAGPPIFDSLSTWGVESLSCSMTPNETVLFEVHSSSAGSELEAIGGLKCSGTPEGRVVALTPAQQGIAFFSLSEAGNALFGDWAVVDLEFLGFSAGAISFQAGPVANTDDVFVFDGTEYSQFPSTLATNFLYPGSGSAKADEGAFILFTLNGQSGVGSAVQVKIDFYDQFERSRNADYAFPCFAFVYFDELSPNWTAEANLGSFAGHAIMSPRGASPFHGWIVQFDGAAAWARTLVSNAGNFPTATFDDD